MSSSEEEDRQNNIAQLLKQITEVLILNNSKIENTRLQRQTHKVMTEEHTFELNCHLKRLPVEDLSLEEARLCYLENKRLNILFP